MCFSCFVHLISTYYVRKGSWLCLNCTNGKDNRVRLRTSSRTIGKDGLKPKPNQNPNANPKPKPNPNPKKRN